VDIVKQIADRVIEGNIAEVEGLTKQAVEQKVDIQKIMDDGFVPGLDVVGEKYTAGEFFLPEMLMSDISYLDVKPPYRILLGPGPSNIHPRVQRAMIAPLVGHLDPYFVTVMDDTMNLLPLRKKYCTVAWS